MTDLPEFTTGVQTKDGAPYVEEDDNRFATCAQLLAVYPALIDPGNEATLARLVTHMARGTAFAVVNDPAAFEAEYRAALAAEDPGAPFQEMRPRRTDFGIPDFTAIAPPRREGDRLVFTLQDSFTGVPFAAMVDYSALDHLSVEPMALQPISQLADEPAMESESVPDEPAGGREPLSDESEMDLAEASLTYEAPVFPEPEDAPRRRP